MTAARLPAGLQPTETQEGLLRAALAPPDDLERRWRDLQPLDLERLEHGTLSSLPFVYARLRDAGIDDPQLPRLKGAYRNVWYRNRLQLERLPGTIAVAGRGAVLVGDVPLATVYYPSTGLRLIRRVELLTADKSLVSGPEPGTRRDSLHVLADARRRSGVFAALAARAQERQLAGRTVHTPSPADELLLVCALASTSTGRASQWLLDLSQILRSGSPIDAEQLARDAEEHGLALLLASALGYLKTLDPELEAMPIVTALARARPTRRDRIAHRLIAAPPGRVGSFPSTLGRYLRLSRRDSLPRAVLRLPRFLAGEWGVAPGRVALLGLRKALTVTVRGHPESS